MNYIEVMKRLEDLASHDPKDLAGMARFGINIDKAWVISIPKLRILAKEIKKSVISTEVEKSRSLGYARDDKTGSKALHKLALQVWDSGVHEAQILASMIDEPKFVTEVQMEKWVLGFDSWDVCDQVCGNLFDKTEFAIKKAREWSERPEEFVKRAGFVIMAWLAVHNKGLEDSIFVEFLEIIKRQSGDNRNFVRKAVNWALRSIGKSRNKYLYEKAIETTNVILNQCEKSKIRVLDPSYAQDDRFNDQEYLKEIKAMNFIAGDAKRELEKDYIKNRFI